MLTINKKNFNIKQKNINVSACTYNPETEEVIVILDGEHNIPNNKSIKLLRNLVDGDVFSENFIVKSSIVSYGKTYVTIGYKLTDYLLYVPISDEPFKNVFLLQMFLGLRIGEALALQISDINLYKNIIIHTAVC